MKFQINERTSALWKCNPSTMLQEFSQFNGDHGCGFCYHPEESMKKGAGTVQTYQWKVCFFIEHTIKYCNLLNRQLFLVNLFREYSYPATMMMETLRAFCIALAVRRQWPMTMMICGGCNILMMCRQRLMTLMTVCLPCRGTVINSYVIRCFVSKWVSEYFLNATSAQLDYTVPFRLDVVKKI